MKNDEIQILEIAVDRHNEKGVFIAKEMLSTLHDVLNFEKKSLIPNFRKRPQFRFFLVHAAGRIRFFIETPKKYKDFLESQLYAHYNNIEITNSELPFAENQEFFTQEAHLGAISAEQIKLYVNLKDKTEKESIDPLSPLTSVLSHSAKNEFSFFRIDFSPLEDDKFRSDFAKEIISAKISDKRKMFRLAHWWWVKFFIFPLTALVFLLKILTGNIAKPEENTTEKKEETEEEKFASFGYSVRIVMASTRRERNKELASGLTIFASPK